MALMFPWWGLLGAFVAGGLLVWAVLSARLAGVKQLSDHFKALSQDALHSNNQQFLQLATENLQRFQTAAAGDLTQRQTSIDNLLKPVNEHLQKMATKLQEIEQDRKGTDSALRTMIDRIAKDQNTLQTETSRLVQALRAPSGRGQWGEMQLKRVLDMAGMQEGVDYERQASGQGVRPDVVIRLPGKQNLVIDAKTPMSAYLDACREGISEDERGLLMRKHAEQVRSHIKILGSKDYIAQFQTPELIVMFLPDENFYRVALEYDPSLMEFGIDYKVILATPTTLIALLRAVAYGLRQEKLSQNAESVLKLSDELYKRVGTFMKHFDKLGNGLNTAVKSFNEAAGSLERQFMSTVRKMQDLSGQQKLADNTPIPTIEQLARPLAMNAVENETEEV